MRVARGSGAGGDSSVGVCLRMCAYSSGDGYSAGWVIVPRVHCSLHSLQYRASSAL